MNKAAADTSYENTMRSMLHAERGSYADLGYLPVFRASALFYAAHDAAITTFVSFLHYWREKNANIRVSALISLRGVDGALVRRDYVRLEKSVYTFRVADMLGEATGAPFRGSMEIEIHSDTDLKFAFPAMYVFYETAGGITYVHSNQRVFNNREDERRSAAFNPGQSGFDVRFDQGRRSCVWLVNGPAPVERAEMQLRLYDRQGHELRRHHALGTLPPFASREIDLAAIPGAPEHLRGEVGCAKFDIGLPNTFCRFLVGVEDADRSWRTVTHSYFDCIEHADYYGTEVFPEGIDPCLIPVHLVDGVDCDLVFYPILAPAKLALALRAYDEAGGLRADIPLPATFDSRDGKMERIDLRRVLRARNVADGPGLYSCHVRAPDGKVPARVTFGLNYRQDGRAGTNISSSALLASHHGAKKRSWLWGAAVLRPGSRNVAMISNLSKQYPKGPRASYAFSLHDEGGRLLEHRGELADGTGHNIEIEPLLAAHGVERPGDVLWYVVQSENPNLIANQITISRQGNIGGDHSF